MKKEARRLIALTLAAAPLHAAPPNDAFENAATLSGTHAEVVIDMADATSQPGEMGPFMDAKSVWYKWTAPATGRVFFDAFIREDLVGDEDQADTGIGGFPWGVSNDARLNVYTGSTLESLVAVGTRPYVGDPFYFDPRENYWVVDAVAGQTYQIALWKYPWSTDGTARISLFQGQMPPANDAFASPVVIPANAVYSALGHTYGATRQEGEPDLPEADWWWMTPPEVATVWYALTPNSADLIEFETSNATCNVEITVFAGSQLQDLEQITSNAGPGPDRRTVVRWRPAQGTLYRIRVATGAEGLLDNGMGRFNVNVSRPQPASAVRRLVLEARTALGTRQPGSMAEADRLLTDALAGAPSDPEANFLRALCRMALLGESAEFKMMVDSLLMDTPFSLDPWDMDVPVLDGEDLKTRADANTKVLADWLHSGFLPGLDAIRTHLDKCPASFVTYVSGAETGDMHYEIDYADVKALSALTLALGMVGDFMATYDLALPLQTLLEWDRTGSLTAERVRGAHTNLLRFSATDKRLQFREKFAALRVVGRDALGFARNERVRQAFHLWSVDDIDPETEVDLLDQADLIESSFQGATIDLGSERVNLSKFVSTPASLREWLPGFAGNSAVQNSFPDPTFGGMFPDVDQEGIGGLIEGMHKVVDLGTFGSYAASLLSTFTPAERAPQADPDGDGRSNLHEYAFGGDPSKPDPRRSVVAVVPTVGGTPGDFRVEFSRRRGLPGVDYVVAVSDDLRVWDRSGARVVALGDPEPNDDGVTETVRYRIEGLGGAKVPAFVRIEANLVP